MKRFVVMLLIIVGVAARAEATLPKVVFVVRVEDANEVKATNSAKLEARLSQLFYESEWSGIALCPPEDTKRAKERALREDFHVSDDSLAVLAKKAEAQYGLSLLSWIGTVAEPSAGPPDPQKRPRLYYGMALTARIVREDGKRFGDEVTFREPMLKRKPEAVFRLLAARVLASEQLGLRKLPSAKEAPGATLSPGGPVSPVAVGASGHPGMPGASAQTQPGGAGSTASAAATPGVGATSSPTTLAEGLAPPPLPAAEVSSTQRLLGKIGVGTGVGLAAVGGVLLGLASADNSQLRPDEQRALPQEQRALATAAVTKQAVGIGFLAAGAALAGVASVVWYLSPEADVRVSALPGPSGVGLAVSGVLP